MPFDVLGCTRVTLTRATSGRVFRLLVFTLNLETTSAVTLGQSSKARRDGDRGLELFVFNEECLVSASHQLALITSLPFVHTARRYYRLNGSASFTDCG